MWLSGSTDDPPQVRDRKSTRLNSSHLVISYAVFCLKKKKTEFALMSSFKRIGILTAADSPRSFRARPKTAADASTHHTTTTHSSHVQHIVINKNVT